MINQLIYESKRSKIFLTKDDDNKDPSILKILNNQYPTPREIGQFYNELSISNDLNSPNARKAIASVKYQNRHALQLEWFDGSTFLESFKNKRNDILDFLYIAIEISKSLEDIHSSGIIHKDITPNNILINLQKRKINIIDFGISSKYQTQQYDLSHPKNLQGTLTYCSPEQTGRMNRSIDFRSDLYSLGITFFTILAGNPPFVFEDAMELVHAHIAHAPPKITDLNPSVPPALSEIISKLIEKNAEDRYQSAYGLRKDLEICLKEYRDNKVIIGFEIGQHDYSGYFRIHQKLYGRENEIEKILLKYDECAKGNSQLLLVAGYSGTGKTALVHEVHRPITLTNGYYVEWKFDQFNKSTPYSALLQVLINLVDILLAEEENKLIKITKEIQEAVGEEGKVLTDLLPNLKKLIGEQPDIPELGGEESQRRFTYLVQKFFLVICTKEHPIVFFIDDLQWADAASLQLLNSLLSLPDLGNFLCIGAYRDNEVKEGHPLLASLANMENSGVKIETIKISNLRPEDIQHLICDSLDKNFGDKPVIKLTDLILSKTMGNAFFTIQFLKSLADDNFLNFDFENRSWTWEIDKIKRQNITDNVVELMADKVKKLPESTQRVLKYMAALGNAADLEMLAIVSETAKSENDITLDEAQKEGLIFNISDNQIKFAHDRIQQAVYSLLSNKEKIKVHYKIGKLLHKNSIATKNNERIFDIVNHYNSSIDIFKSGEEKDRIILSELNYKAALKAKLNSAFDVALDYLKQSLSLLPNNPWDRNYRHTYSVFKELTEISYLCAQYDLTDQYFGEINANATSAMDKVKAYEVKINAFKAKNNLPAAIDTGLEALALLGKKLPRHPTKLQVMAGLVITEFKLRNVTVDSILNLPKMEDPKEIEAMRILTNISPSAYWAEPNLIPLISYEMIGMTLKHGLDILSAYCLAGYGIILCGVLGAMRKGQKYGEIGLKILDAFETKAWSTQIKCPVHALVDHWNKHVELSLIPLRNTFYTGLETGENEFACVNANIYCIHSFLVGKPLEGLEKETKAYSQTFKQLKQETQSNYNEVYRQAMHNLMGMSDEPSELAGSAYNSNKMLPIHIERKDKTGIFFIYFNRMIVSYFFERYQEASEFAAKTLDLVDAVLSKFEIPNLYFYRSLSALAVASEIKSANRKKLLSIAKNGLKKLKYFSKFAPENYKHKCSIIQSQFALIKGDFQRARLLFDQAISEAGKHNFLHEEALAYELAGKAYNQQGFINLAKYYLNNAFNLYREWGANAKMDHLINKYPALFTEISSSANKQIQNTSTNLSSTLSFSDRTFDINTLLKASTSISSQVELPALLTKLMEIAIENAGAQKGALILVREEKLVVEAIRDISEDYLELLQNIPINECENLPSALIQYVFRTQKNMVNHSYEDLSKFNNDTYLQSVKPESILGLPIINQGKFIGVIYLENRFTKNVFAENKISILSMLSSQIAVSIDNAMLYQNLELKVKERTKELAIEKQKSDDLLSNILPKEVAEELKETGKTIPKYYESVTVLFADFAGFTHAATKMSASQLVNTIDSYFREFDKIVQKYNLEKIKTIGDAYMCAGGLPVPNSTHANDAIQAAFDMIKCTRKHKNILIDSSLYKLDIRIGIHTGPLVAGVVGTDKFAYDIWGNTVNKASRLETNGKEGRINISEETYHMIKDTYDCTLRGSINAKNLGEINMYFVESELQNT